MIIFNWFGFFCWVIRVLYKFFIQVPCQIQDLQKFPPFLWFCLSLSWCYPSKHKSFKFSCYLFLSLLVLMVSWLSYHCLTPKPCIFVPMFSSKYVIVTFGSSVHLEIIFVQWCDVRSNFVLLHGLVPFVEKITLPHWLLSPVEKQLSGGLVFQVTLLPYLSVLTSAAHCLDHCSFVVFWNQEVLVPPTLLFFKIVLAIVDPWNFYVNFRINLSISVKRQQEFLQGLH